MNLINIENLHIHADGCADSSLSRLILERLKIMPTKDETIAAVNAAVEKERAQHLAAVKKAVEDEMAKAGVSQDLHDKIIAAIDSTVVDGGPSPDPINQA